MNPKITAVVVLIVAYFYLKSNYFRVDSKQDLDPIIQILYEFNFYNYTFENPDQYNQYLRSGMNKKTVLSGVKFSDSGRIFVSLPRWKLNSQGESIPATFCEIKSNSTNNPLLTPYPSWQQNKVILSEEDALKYDYLQNVLGFEIDGDTLWIIDQAIVGGIQGKYIPNTIKLVKINLTTDSIQYVYRFPEEVAGNSSLLNDLVIDKLNGFIYISDPDIYHPPNEQLKGGIVMIDIKKEPYTSKRFFSGSKFTNNDEQLWLTINNVKITKDAPLRVGVDGIAITPDNKKLVFCPLISHMIFQVDTELMVQAFYDQIQQNDVIKRIIPLFPRNFASDGILYGKDGKLYMTSLEGSGVVQWDGVRSTYLVQNNITMLWPDALALDNKGYLYIVTNEMHLFLFNEKDVTTRIHKIQVGSKSYL